MVVVCPACEAIVGFEIEMIRHDSAASSFPMCRTASTQPSIESKRSFRRTKPARSAESSKYLRARAGGPRTRSGACATGPRHHAAAATDRNDSQRNRFSARANLGRDPLGPKPKELPTLANLSVHLVGSDGLAARWAIAPAAGSGIRTINSHRLARQGRFANAQACQLDSDRLRRPADNRDLRVQPNPRANLLAAVPRRVRRRVLR